MARNISPLSPRDPEVVARSPDLRRKRKQRAEAQGDWRKRGRFTQCPKSNAAARVAAPRFQATSSATDSTNPRQRSEMNNRREQVEGSPMSHEKERKKLDTTSMARETRE
jgi:hypothetical protein